MSSFNCFVVGLTGGIGSGKSTASQYFEQLGIQIVNADQVARDCVMPGTSALDEIINHFGKKIIDKNGNLNRSELRKIIFDKTLTFEEKIVLPNSEISFNKLVKLITNNKKENVTVKATLLKKVFDN